MTKTITINNQGHVSTFKLQDNLLIEDLISFGGMTFDVDPLKERGIYYIPVRIEEPIANMINGAPFATEQYYRAVATNKAAAIQAVKKRFAHLPATGRKATIVSEDRIFRKEIGE